MTPIEFHPEAAQEANDSVDYYTGIHIDLGDDFRVELKAALDRIFRNPMLYSIESGAIRTCSLHRFPYSVYFSVFADCIWVAAIGHHSRRPGYWTGRSADAL